MPAPCTSCPDVGTPPFFLLPDEEEAYARYEATWLVKLDPRDLAERDAALEAIRTRWRQARADRLEAQVLADLFAAGDIEDEAQRSAAKREAMRGLATVIRYRSRFEREHDRAVDRFDALRDRPDADESIVEESDRSTSEPEPTAAASPSPASSTAVSSPTPPVAQPAANTGVPSEPSPHRPLNRHQRRALAARARQAKAGAS